MWGRYLGRARLEADVHCGELVDLSRLGLVRDGVEQVLGAGIEIPASHQSTSDIVLARPLE